MNFDGNVVCFGNSLAYGNVVNEDFNHLTIEVFEVHITLNDLFAVVTDFDFYIDLFDAHSQSILRAYYDDDLSLAEIAAGEGISRQGIRHIIKKSEEMILFYEEKLGLAKKHEALESAAKTLDSLKSEILSESFEKDSAASEIDSVIGTILSKGV